MPAKPNSFVWYELVTTDLDAAEKFYGSVVGWTAQPWGGGDYRYTIVSAGDRPIAGAMELTTEMCDSGGKPGWLGYVGVPDVDAGAERLKTAGGAVLRAPEDIPEIGRFAVVADPHGAVFILFTPKAGDPTPAAAGTPGHVGWHELLAGNGEEAFAFYSGQFGWTKDQAMDMGPMGVYQLFRAGGDAVGAVMTKTPDMPVPAWNFYFNVPAIDAAVERVTQGGGRVLNGPMEVPGPAWIIQAVDPQGAMFSLVAPKR